MKKTNSLSRNNSKIQSINLRNRGEIDAPKHI